MRQTTPRRWKRHSRVEIGQIVAAFRQSGLSARAFARQRGLVLSTLMRWLQGQSPGPAPGLLGNGFVEALAPPMDLRPAGLGAAYSLSWPDGRRLEMTSGFDQRELRSILELINL